jgi:hypothetical protein
MNLDLLPKEKLFLSFHSIILQSVVNFGAKSGGFQNLQDWYGLEKWKTICYRARLRTVRPKYRFELAPLFKCRSRATNQ